MLNVLTPSHFEQPNDTGVGELIKERVKSGDPLIPPVFWLNNCDFN